MSKRNSNKSEKPKKRRDGTPDKAATPAASAADDDGTVDSRSHDVINDEEIQSLVIKHDQLQKIREDILADRPRIPEDQRSIQLSVRRAHERPPSMKATKVVKVAKGAPPHVPLKPIEVEGNSGPRYDNKGHVINHSILGSLTDYQQIAEKKGNLVQDGTTDDNYRDVEGCDSPTYKYVRGYSRNQRRTRPPTPEQDESNALINWQLKMRERKLQQGYISRLLNKPVEQLVMNQGEAYREKQELRYLIDRSIPAVDYGKGYRVGSEFWKQRPLIGDDETGIHMSLGQTEQGYPPPITHIRAPIISQIECGIDLSKPSSALHKPWSKSKFLKERVEQLQTVMHDLDPYNPETNHLQIIGTSAVDGERMTNVRTHSPLLEISQTKQEEADPDDPLGDHPYMYEEPIFGPCLKFAGEVLKWTGDSHSNQNWKAADARVAFEASAGCRATSVLEMANLGTAAIYYSWKMIPQSNPFELVNADVQRFYFNTSNGVILPGDHMKFPFVFKSDKAGVFTEQWQFETHPAVAGGASLLVSLRGVALRIDKHKKQRGLLEEKLQRNIAQKNVQMILDEIIDSIKEKNRPSSPCDIYMTNELLFNRQNSQLNYNHSTVEKLKELHKIITLPPTMEEDGMEETPSAPEWNLNVQEFKEELLHLDDEDERKVAFLENVNDCVATLSVPHTTPRLRDMYQTCYQCMSDWVDFISTESAYLRSLLNLPDITEQQQQQQLSSEQHPTSQPDDKGGKSGGAAAGKQAGKAAPKEEKKAAKGDAKKDAKKEPPNAVAKKDRASPTKKTPPSRSGIVGGTSATHLGEGRLTPGPGYGDGGTTPDGATSRGGNPAIERKYRDKLTAQVYMYLDMIVCTMADRFEEIPHEPQD